MVRPEQIWFERVTRAGAVKAKVIGVTFFGHDATVQMSLEAGATQVRVRVAGHIAPEPGTDAWLSVEGVVMAYPCSPPLVETSVPLAGRQSPGRPAKEASRGAGSFGDWVRAQPQGAGPNAKI
jgi:hypothetical protein